MKRKPDNRNLGPELITEFDAPQEIESYHVTFWDKLNAKIDGWKSVVGLGLVQVGEAVETVEPVWSVVLKVLGWTITGGGIFHKIAKAQTKVGKKGEFNSKEWKQLLIELYSVLMQIWNKYKLTKKGN